MLLLATFCLAAYMQISQSATCANSNPSTGSFLTSPEEFSWDVNKEATITFDKTTISIKNQNNEEYKWIISRLHNGLFPSPTIRVVPGETYTLKLINNLDAETHQSGNKMKDPNITNIHTHGFHISGESPADNIFKMVNGGEETTYIYNVPCDHSGGTMWYHPHHHGSVAIQVGGGAVGAFIIEDNELYETTSDGVPNWYTNLKTDELILVIQAMNLGVVKGWEDTINGGVFDYDDTNSNLAAFYAVNGKYRPTICLEQNKYRKFRIVFADAVVPTTSITISSECTVYLLSRDGVLVHGSDNTVPRLLDSPKNELLLSMASRADIAVNCPYSSSGTNVYEIKAAGKIIADLNVIENSQNVLDDLSQTWHPKRPKYLQSLLDATNSKKWSQTVALGSNHIMNEQFKDSTTYLNDIYPHQIAVGDVIEWDIDVMLMGIHPFHIHVNHFQVQSFGGGMGGGGMGGGGMGGGGMGGMGGMAGGCSTDTSFCKIGDWIDTMDYSGTIRFHADRFSGRSVMHCHVLEHEDEGAMGTVRIDGSDDTSDCNGYQFVAPTPTPPVPSSCTADGDRCSSNSDCCSGTCSGMMWKSCRSSVIGIPEITPLNNELWMKTNWIVMILIGILSAVFGGFLVYCYYTIRNRDNYRKGYLQNSDEKTDSEVEELSKI